MNLYAARDLAISLLRRHGLDEWTFRFDHARRRFGACRYGQKTITLSRYLTFLNSDEQVRDTILHEIAHALAPGDGHGAKWKRKCREIGAVPRRCYRDEEVISPPRRIARYQIGCPHCNWWQDRHRRPGRKLICRTCRAAVRLREKTQLL
jgi:predicted SprT family Zn-dependent metalloprotease